MAKSYDNEDGVWRTIGGRRVFIRNGQSLSDAMKESGKFSRVEKNKDKYENVNENSTYVDSEIADLDAKHKNKEQVETSKALKELEESIKKDQETGNTANRLKAIEDKERYDRLYDKKVYDEGMSEKKFKELYGERPKTGLEDIGKEKPSQEVIDAVKTAYIYKDEGEMASGLKSQQDRFGKDAVDKAFKYYDDNYVLIKGAQMDSEGLTYNNLLEKKDFSKEALDEYVKGMNDLRNEMQYSYEPKEYNKRADELFDKLKQDTIRDALRKDIAEKQKTNWRDEVKKNNDQLNKETEDLQKKINELRNKSYQENSIERYRYWQEAEKLQEQYYEKFRENERRNAKIKKEEPNEPYEFVEAYDGYKRKFNDIWGEDGTGNKSVSAKMYTNDEFLEHLEDANWHGERRQLLEANLTNEELSYIKDRTKVSAWGVDNLSGKEQTQKLIDEAKAKFEGNKMINSLRNKAYQKYIKEHPGSKLTLEEFKDMNRK